MVKTIHWIQHTKKNRTRKKEDKFGKELYNIMNNAIIRKKVKNLWNGIHVKLVNKKKDYLICISKPNHKSDKIFDNKLVAIRKSKLILKLKQSYIGMCILGLSKVLMHEFHYDYIKNKYHNKSKLLFTDTYSSMHEIKTGNVYEDCSKKNV